MNSPRRTPTLIVCLGVNCTAIGAASGGGRVLYDHLDSLLSEADPFDPPFELRTANCLDMCGLGPNVVIHPGNHRHNHVDVTRLAVLLDTLQITPRNEEI